MSMFTASSQQGMSKTFYTGPEFKYPNYHCQTDSRALVGQHRPAWTSKADLGRSESSSTRRVRLLPRARHGLNGELNGRRVCARVGPRSVDGVRISASAPFSRAH